MPPLIIHGSLHRSSGTSLRYTSSQRHPAILKSFKMTTLPSFVELMSTLGVDTNTRPQDDAASSPRSSRSASPHLSYSPISSPTRSKSSQSLREPTHRVTARYSPYSPPMVRLSSFYYPEFLIYHSIASFSSFPLDAEVYHLYQHVHHLCLLLTWSAAVFP